MARARVAGGTAGVVLDSAPVAERQEGRPTPAAAGALHLVSHGLASGTHLEVPDIGQQAVGAVHSSPPFALRGQAGDAPQFHALFGPRRHTLAGFADGGEVKGGLRFVAQSRCWKFHSRVRPALA